MEFKFSLLEMFYLVFVMLFLGAIVYNLFFNVAPKELMKMKFQQRILHNLSDVDLEAEYLKVIESEYFRKGKESGVKAHICLFHSDYRDALNFIETRFERRV